MFKKYITKISNTIGTVNYLQQKTKENRHRSHRTHRNHQLLYDDGYDVDIDYDPSTHMEIDLTASGSRKNSVFIDEYAPNEQIILSEAIAHLRTLLLFYPLVQLFIFAFKFIKIIFFKNYFNSSLQRQFSREIFEQFDNEPNEPCSCDHGVSTGRCSRDSIVEYYSNTKS